MNLIITQRTRQNYKTTKKHLFFNSSVYDFPRAKTIKNPLKCP
jgi:hypothetical protein